VSGTQSSRKFVGMLTPSSNTVLEPVCAAMLAGVPGVTTHFARFRVTEIALSRDALGQFDQRPMLEAAALLADARCHSISWNGTSAGWLGFDADRRLCASIRERTGIPASSSVLALEEVFRRTGVKRYGLVSPYTDDVQARIVANFAAEGFACAAERHAGLSVNFAFSELERGELARMIRAAAAERPDAITVFCTNMDGASLAEPLERELGIPIYDTIALSLWASLRAAGVDAAQVKGWGRLFREVP
jgi:maleate isomerase